jgi:transcriptional regulator with XRE-family HTH domain
LQQRQGVSAREIARRGKVIAEALRKPQLAFTHRAVCGWLNGMRNPSLEHRRVLAVILGVTLDELNHECDGPFEAQKAAATLKQVTVRVLGKERTFEYRMTVSSRVDLNRPAVYQHWADMFSPWPASLVRHLGRTKHDLYGWVPGLARSPSLREAGVLVALNAQRPKLDPAGTLDALTWFVYLPGGRLDIGKAVREDRWLVLSRRGINGIKVERYPLSRIDLVGRVTGRALLEVSSRDQKLT